MSVPGILVCSSFLISVCMFIVSKALLISSATVIVRAGRAIWLNPFAMVLFTLCSAITIECCVLYPCCVGVFAITKRRDIGLYEVPLSMSIFVGFWDGDYVSQLPYVWYYVGVKSSFQHAREGLCTCFRCLVFNLSGPCELSF